MIGPRSAHQRRRTALLTAALLATISSGCGGSGQLAATPTPTPHVGGAAEAAPFFSAFRGELDPSVWIKADGGSFAGNGCWSFTSAAVSGPDFLSLWIRRLEQPIQNKSYSGAGLTSQRLFSYGTFTVSMRGPIVSGSTCSFFLMNPWQPGHWLHKEIDIEFLGKSQYLVQFTVHRVYSDSAQQTSPSSCLTTLPFDYKADFHEYGIRWAPDRIAWLVDGREICQEAQRIPDEPLNILMNHWVYDPNDSGTAPGMAAWLGPLNDADLPSHAEYAWVRYAPLE